MRMTAAEFRAMSQAKPTKYGNEPVWIDGIRFESKAEGKRYCELKLLQAAGEITELELQPRFKLTVNGIEVCTYIGDFRYWHNHSKKRVCEDVKGVSTPAFRLKAKLFRAVFGYDIVLVKS
ncbi:Protein of unknown function [Phyllobacterium sp. CL33Tsu]|nr:Protein of unknown function [Phyllobacterium sp. CL33Tsu]